MSVGTFDLHKICRQGRSFLGEFEVVALAKKAVLITRLSVITLSSLVLTGCYMPVVDNKDVKRAKKTPHIAYQQLTTEASHPVLFQTPERIEAIKTYPTTRACLIESERTSENPDLRLIDWKHIRKRAELEVCLWRIFSSLEDFQSIMEWMSFHHVKDGHKKDIASRYNGLQDLVLFKSTHGGSTFKGSFYWHKDKGLPFRDEVPVPRIFLGAFIVTIDFRQSHGRPVFLTAEWQQTM